MARSNLTLNVRQTLLSSDFHAILFIGLYILPLVVVTYYKRHSRINIQIILVLRDDDYVLIPKFHKVLLFQ
jgi:hypothetical protein